MAFFPTVEGSMTSEDGHNFMLHVKWPTRGDLLLGLVATYSPPMRERPGLENESWH